MSAPLAEADLLEDLDWLDQSGVGAIEAASRTGFATSRALGKWLERHGRPDLWKRMKARDPEGLHHQIKRKTAAVTETTDTLAALLAKADASPRVRTRNRAAKIREAFDELRAALVEDEDREKARKEVERLEQQLAQAKARLRGGEAKVKASTSNSAEVRRWAAENGVSCPPVGRVPAAVVEAYERATEAAA